MHDTIRGSILIWTVLLGMMLASVFLFAATRLGSTAALQRRTLLYQNEKAYLESYMGYLKTLNLAQLNAYGGVIDEHGVTGTLTNAVEEISGGLDDGESVDYLIKGLVQMEWNRCAPLENGILSFSLSESTPPSFNQCVIVGAEYDAVTGFQPGSLSTLTITSDFAPTHYRLRAAQSDSEIYEDVWTATLSVNLGYRRGVDLQERFLPAS